MDFSKIIVQAIAFFFTVYILIFWIFHKKTGSDNEIIFLFAIIVSMISELLDAAAQITSSDYIFVFSEFATELVMKTYLVTIPLSVFVITLYANFSILDTKRYRILRAIILISSLINSVIIWCLPLTIEIGERCNIPTGPSVLFTYIITAIVGAAIFIELIVNKKKLNKATYIANIVWLLLLLCGGIFQLFTLDNTEIPVISFIIATGDIALYLILENPGNRFDYNKNCFHYETFVKYITETIRFKNVQSILFLNVSTTGNDNVEYASEVFDSMISENFENSEIIMFKGVGSELLITSKEFVILQDIASTVYSHVNKISEKYSVEMKASVVLIPSLEEIETYGLLREIFDDYRIKDNLIGDNIQYFTISDKVITKYNKESIITADIDYAIKNKLIDIRFQSLNSLLGDDLQIYEIITTLTNDKNKVLFPSDYSRIATRGDKFLQIDEYSFEKVCTVLEKVLSHRNRLGYVLIRISVQAIEQEHFLDRIIEMMRKHDVPYKYVCFEITNANAILKKDVLLKNITYMQKLGMSFAMGGFGSGESNLNYFIDLPMNIVKFDQSILKNAIIDPRAAMIMKDVTELAHALGFKVIAVGAKDDEEIKFIKDCGIEMVIGDQLSNIIDVNEFIKNTSLGGAQL